MAYNSLKEKYEQIDSGVFGRKIIDKAKAYKIGVFVGAGLGLLAGVFVFKRKIILCTVIGAIGGGYAYYSHVEGQEELPVFKNYGEAPPEKEETNNKKTEA